MPFHGLSGAPSLGASSKNYMLIHGWLLWVAWTFFAMLQILSNRYLKHYWYINMWVHRISGLMITTLTIAMVLYMFSNMSWTLMHQMPHAVNGIIIIICVVLVMA